MKKEDRDDFSVFGPNEYVGSRIGTSEKLLQILLWRIPARDVKSRERD